MMSHLTSSISHSNKTITISFKWKRKNPTFQPKQSIGADTAHLWPPSSMTHDLTPVSIIIGLQLCSDLNRQLISLYLHRVIHQAYSYIGCRSPIPPVDPVSITLLVVGLCALIANLVSQPVDSIFVKPFIAGIHT